MTPSRAARILRALSCLVLCALPLSSAAAQVAPKNPEEPRNLVVDGSFEATPVAAEPTSVPASAWSAEAGALRLRNRVGALTAFAGEQLLALDSLAVVRQTCATRAGQSYSLSLAYCPRPEAGPVAFEVWFAGVRLDTVVVPGGSAATWVHRDWPVVGTSAAGVLELRALDAAAEGVLLDDVWLLAFDPASSEARLRNGQFEEDPHIDPGTSISNPVFAGWYSPTDAALVVRDVGLTSGSSGGNVLSLGAGGAGLGLAQRVFVVPGQSYQLRFASSPNPADDRERSFRVSFAGEIVDTVRVPRGGALAWTQRTYTVRSSSPLAVLEFTDLGGGLVGGTGGALLDALTLTGPRPEAETDGQVERFTLIAHTPTAGLRLGIDDMFARGVTALGDLDGDGVQDLAVGALGDDDGALDAGAVWILFLRTDRTLKGSAKISETRGGLATDLKDDGGFGRALAGLGDLDGDGVPDLAVGASQDDTGGVDAGATYVLFLNRNGTVKAKHVITALSGDALAFPPRAAAEFGSSLACLGDVDGDGIPDLAVGARVANSVQVCFLRRDGSVRASTQLTYGLNGFTEQATSADDLFGVSAASMGDFDGDGVPDLLVGACGRAFAGQIFVGAQYLLLLERDGTCKRWLGYGPENMNPRSQTLGLHYDLGTACAGPGDVDGDGVRDLVVGAHREGPLEARDQEQVSKPGAVYVLLLNQNGTIKTCQRLGDRAGGFDYRIVPGTRWGESLAALGDHDGNGLVDLAVGSRFLARTGGLFLCELASRTITPAPLQAGFTGAPTTGNAPLTVAFGDRSSGAVTGWSWSFGDGTSSTLASPSHTYSVPGSYTVALTVSGAGGTSTKSTVAFVVVSPTVPPGDALPPGVTRLGCGVNPASSFRILSGSPRLGSTMVFGVDNPFGTQAVGSIPVLFSSWTAEPNRPCGSLVPGQGMAFAGASGERLVVPPTLPARTGTAWAGPGQPAPVTFPIPVNASLIGRTLYVQGRLTDRKPGALIPIGLADGFALTLQP